MQFAFLAILFFLPAIGVFVARLLAPPQWHKVVFLLVGVGIVATLPLLQEDRPDELPVGTLVFTIQLITVAGAFVLAFVLHALYQSVRQDHSPRRRSAVEGKRAPIYSPANIIFVGSVGALLPIAVLYFAPGSSLSGHFLQVLMAGGILLVAAIAFIPLPKQSEEIRSLRMVFAGAFASALAIVWGYGAFTTTADNADELAAIRNTELRPGHLLLDPAHVSAITEK